MLTTYGFCGIIVTMDFSLGNKGDFMTVVQGVVARIVHRNADGTRCENLAKHGIVSYSNLLQNYPQDADTILGYFGNLETSWIVRNHLWDLSDKDMGKVHVKLFDGTYLALQG